MTFDLLVILWEIPLKICSINDFKQQRNQYWWIATKHYDFYHTHISGMHSILLLSHVANHSICAGNNVMLLLYLSFVCQHYTSCIFLSLFIFYKMLCWNIRIKANIKWIGDTDFFALTIWFRNVKEYRSKYTKKYEREK